MFQLSRSSWECSRRGHEEERSCYTKIIETSRPTSRTKEHVRCIHNMPL